MIEPKYNVMTLLEPVLSNQKSKQGEEDLMARIGQVCDILQEHPELKTDQEIYATLLSATKNSVDQKIIQFRRGLLVDHCLPKDNTSGVLAIAKDEWNQLPTDKLWKYIENHDIKKLVISDGEGDSVIYEGRFLKLLLENKPELIELTEMYTLQFNDGSMTMPKAKLRLCGEYFESLFAGEMQEVREKSIKFGEISLNGFRDILHAIDTEEYDFDDYSDEFRVAANYLDFSPTIEIPEGIYGQEVWEKYWGDVGEVPIPPIALIKAMKGPCPIRNKEGIADGPKMGDTHIIFWRPPTVDGEPLTVTSIENIAKSEKFGDNKIGYYYCYPEIRNSVEVNRPIESGYWLAVLKGLPDETRDKKYAEQLAYIQKNCPEYEVPSTIDALLYCLMPYAISNEIILGQEPTLYTCCKEATRWGQNAVGALATSGLAVSYHAPFDPLVGVGVCPSRKFF